MEQSAGKIIKHVLCEISVLHDIHNFTYKVLVGHLKCTAWDVTRHTVTDYHKGYLLTWVIVSHLFVVEFVKLEEEILLQSLCLLIL